MITVRLMRESDAARIVEIQAASPEASNWKASDYLLFETWVAVAPTGDEPSADSASVVGFLCLRATAGGEAEILNTAVDPPWRRRGVARRLLAAALQDRFEEVYLEVRESNAAAIQLYASIGFQPAGIRPGYYKQPDEAGIVMKLQKW